MKNNYLELTELAGGEVSQEQVDRLYNRYYWAGNYCNDKVVLEVACGTGQGLGFLAEKTKHLYAGDYSNEILKISYSHYGKRVAIKQFDAQYMPYLDNSMDIIILFEAIYYIPVVEKFITECKRILKKNGKLLIATANKDLYDFNSSPNSFKYYGVVELNKLFLENDFDVNFFGNTPVAKISFKQKVFRPIKKVAAVLGLIPKTMKGKKLLKRFIFGSMVTMPAEIKDGMMEFKEPVAISPSIPDNKHKVIYCAATLKY